MRTPPPMMRRPLLRIQPGASMSTPIFRSCLVARGVRPSPHTFSRGKTVFSSSRTLSPAWARWYAVVEPDGPAPTTMTSASVAERSCGMSAGVSVTRSVTGILCGQLDGGEQCQQVGRHGDRGGGRVVDRDALGDDDAQRD